MSETRIQHSELELAIDDLVASYGTDLEINNLESAALPNRRAVIEAFNHLVPALFLGFYSRRRLSLDNLRYSLSEHLYPGFELLVDQIHRAVTYERSQGRFQAGEGNFSAKAVLELFRALPDLRRRLNGDVLAAYSGDPAARSIEEVVFSYPGLRALTAHRVAHVLYRSRVPVIPRIISEYAHAETGIDIHAGAQIGDRFFIDHGTGVVVGETSIIGNNVKIYQGVTLGALSVGDLSPTAHEVVQKRHPTIEDNVTIYAGARILGGDTVIGHDSVIGGNAWIVRSIPPFSKIFGRAQSDHPTEVGEPATDP